MFSFTVKGTPCKGPILLAGGQLSIRRDRRGAGIVCQHPHDGVQRRIDGFDPRQMRLHHLR